MGVMINIHSSWRAHTEGRKTVEVSNGTVLSCLHSLALEFPLMKNVIFDDRGQLLDSIFVVTNGEFTTSQELNKPLRDGDTIEIIPIAIGG